MISEHLSDFLLGNAFEGSLQGNVYMEPYIREEAEISWLEEVILV